ATSSGAAQVSLPASSLRTASRSQPRCWLVALLSVCWTKAASSRAASTWAADEPPCVSSTSFSSSQPHCDSLPATAISTSVWRSTTARSNTTWGRRGSFWLHASSGQSRQVTRTGYSASVTNPSAQNSRVAATAAYTLPFESRYLTLTVSWGGITHANFGVVPPI